MLEWVTYIFNSFYLYIWLLSPFLVTDLSNYNQNWSKLMSFSNSPWIRSRKWSQRYKSGNTFLIFRYNQPVPWDLIQLKIFCPKLFHQRWISWYIYILKFWQSWNTTMQSNFQCWGIIIKSESSLIKFSNFISLLIICIIIMEIKNLPSILLSLCHGALCKYYPKKIHILFFSFQRQIYFNTKLDFK